MGDQIARNSRPLTAAEKKKIEGMIVLLEQLGYPMAAQDLRAILAAGRIRISNDPAMAPYSALAYNNGTIIFNERTFTRYSQEKGGTVALLGILVHEFVHIEQFRRIQIALRNYGRVEYSPGHNEAAAYNSQAGLYEKYLATYPGTIQKVRDMLEGLIASAKRKEAENAKKFPGDIKKVGGGVRPGTLPAEPIDVANPDGRYLRAATHNVKDANMIPSLVALVAMQSPAPSQDPVPTTGTPDLYESELTDAQIQAHSLLAMWEGVDFDYSTALAFFKEAVRQSGGTIVAYDSKAWQSSTYAAKWGYALDAEELASVQSLLDGRTRITTVPAVVGRSLASLAAGEAFLKVVTTYQGREYQLLLDKSGQIVGDLPTSESGGTALPPISR